MHRAPPTPTSKVRTHGAVRPSLAVRTPPRHASHVCAFTRAVSRAGGVKGSVFVSSVEAVNPPPQLKLRVTEAKRGKAGSDLLINPSCDADRERWLRAITDAVKEAAR